MAFRTEFERRVQRGRLSRTFIISYNDTSFVVSGLSREFLVMKAAERFGISMLNARRKCSIEILPDGVEVPMV
jgi:hypothetical protein